jgi:LysM repeat protein
MHKASSPASNQVLSIQEVNQVGGQLAVIFRNTFKVVLAIAVLAGLMASFIPPALAATCSQYHTVKAGETLYKIGLQYGLTWTRLAEMNDITNPRLIYTGQKLCVSTSGAVSPTPKPPSGKIPTFKILSVVKDQSVTIQTANFPANDSFNVLMGVYGTKAVQGVKVDTFNSGKGGSLTATFKIPASLAGDQRIAIRLQSPTSGYFAYNWFINNTGATPGGSTGGSYSGIPTFSISAVAAGSTVTIKTNNFPAHIKFDVLMGRIGTRAVNGTKVASVDSGNGGTFSATFEIPANLKGLTQIAIRLQSQTSGHFAYNWFYNR